MLQNGSVWRFGQLRFWQMNTAQMSIAYTRQQIHDFSIWMFHFPFCLVPYHKDWCTLLKILKGRKDVTLDYYFYLSLYNFLAVCHNEKLLEQNLGHAPMWLYPLWIRPCSQTDTMHHWASVQQKLPQKLEQKRNKNKDAQQITVTLSHCNSSLVIYLIRNLT